MKKFILPLLTLSTFMLNAQTFVSTQPENKNIILEEFTGISCGYCPDGHRIGQDMHDANPNDVFLINIHTGGYATPQGPGTDFNTSFGAAIASQSNLAGYPAGTVNRHQFTMSQNGGTAMSRSDWSSAANQLLAEPSPVNVGIQANVDIATNTLTVDVEVYYTGSQLVASNKLNIAVVQNNIEGPQSGGAQFNPTAILPNGNYNHQHMLRHLMTGQWGETISNITQGTLFSNQYTWVMPCSIAGVDLDPTNIAVVAFVSEGQQEILSGTEVYPQILFVNTEDVFSTTGTATNPTCANINGTDLSITFKNYGSNVLSSVDIDYSINGGPTNTYGWTGQLLSAGTETVTIPNVSFSPLANNTVDFQLSNPNGVADQNPSNNTSSTTFTSVGSASSGNATVQIITDAYGSETTWNLKNSAGTTVANGGPYNDLTSAGTTSQTHVNVMLDPNDCYTMTVNDSYGDGMNSGYGAGEYTVTDVSGNIVASGGPFTTQEIVYFSTGAATALKSINETKLIAYPNPAKDILNIEGDYTSVDIFDIFGKLVLSSELNKDINVSSLADGIYMLNINTEKGIQTQKITIKK